MSSSRSRRISRFRSARLKKASPLSRSTTGTGLAGVVHERLLAGSVLLAKDGIERALPLAEEVAEAGVLIVLRMVCLVLEPEELKRHAGATQLRLDRLLVPRGAHVSTHGRRRRRELRLQGALRESVRQGPTHPCRLRPPPLATNRGARDLETSADLAIREPLRSQPEHFLDLAHGQPLRCHLASSGWWNRRGARDGLKERLSSVGLVAWGGPLPSEWVVHLDRNRWAACFGTGGPLQPEYAHWEIREQNR